ncbi:hypothetical protein L4O93_003110 [Pseudomonas aeruginosa]|nr:hypothetical protein [Pseudomonas aeruginosa]
MTESKICTCPSGDGSLRHPCPAHPALVEQAGGDERAAFEKIHTVPRGIMWNEEKSQYVRVHEKLCSLRTWNSFVALWAGWMARAALAQPSGEVVVTKNESGAIVSVTRQDKEGRVLSVIAESKPSPAQAEQAEAERPEVVGYRSGTSGGIYADGYGLEKPEPLMTVAQHERIVGELRAVIAQLRQHKNDYMDSGQETYRALQNEIREREAEIARLDGLVSGRTAERDAALAEVERIKTISDNYYVLCVERQQQLDAALARVAELERQEPVALANRGLHAFWVKWTEAAAGLYGPGIKLYAAPAARAQHSVPEEFIGRLSEFLAQRGATGKALLRELRALCAAAPGKEVGHE